MLQVKKLIFELQTKANTNLLLFGFLAPDILKLYLCCIKWVLKIRVHPFFSATSAMYLSDFYNFNPWKKQPAIIPERLLSYFLQF
jgi:hypothetical protein